jgi:signal peptidase I
VKSLLWVAAILGILVGTLRLVALRWVQVPLDDDELAASIAPTLHAGDWIIVWRLTEPSFGDLVMCPDPQNPGYVVIGRVAAEGGDSIRLAGSDIYVNRKKMATESACKTTKLEDPASGATVELGCSMEVMGAATHMRLNTGKAMAVSTEVPPGRVFLLSDNRDLPFDSRHYGTVESDSCKETVVFRIVGKDGFKDVENRLTYIR